MHESLALYLFSSLKLLSSHLCKLLLHPAQPPVHPVRLHWVNVVHLEAASKLQWYQEVEVLADFHKLLSVPSITGTSPHAATSLSVSPGVKQANITWEAGFDGGSAQTFSVWWV